MNRVLAFMLCCAAAGAVRAEGVAAGVRFGTTGGGVEAVGYLTENINLRLTANYMDFNVHGRVDTTDYNFDGHLNTFQGLLDLHPKDGNFRITGGIVYNLNKADVKANPDDTIDVGGREYPSDAVGTIVGEMTFNEWAPYFGIGYGNAVFDKVGLSFSLDVGVMYQGEPQVSLRATGPANRSEAFQQDLAAEEQDVQDEASKYKWYPVIVVGICYQFW